MTRTFSKVYGLAALRIGWLYGPDHVVDALNRTRGPFNSRGGHPTPPERRPSSTRAFIDAAVAHNERWLPWLTDELTGLGLTVTPSVGNFRWSTSRPSRAERPPRPTRP